MQTYCTVSPNAKVTHMLQICLLETNMWLSGNLKLKKEERKKTTPSNYFSFNICTACRFPSWIIEIKLNRKKKINLNQARLLSRDGYRCEKQQSKSADSVAHTDTKTCLQPGKTSGVITSVSDAFVVHTSSYISCSMPTEKILYLFLQAIWETNLVKATVSIYPSLVLWLCKCMPVKL